MTEPLGFTTQTSGSFHTYDDDKKAARIRQFYGIGADQPIPEGLISRLDERSLMRLDESTRMMGTQNLAGRMHQAGVPLNQNIAHYSMVKEFSALRKQKIEEAWVSDRGWLDAPGDAFNMVGTEFVRGMNAIAQGMMNAGGWIDKKTNLLTGYMQEFGLENPPEMPADQSHLFNIEVQKKLLFQTFKTGVYAELHEDMSDAQIMEKVNAVAGTPLAREYLKRELYAIKSTDEFKQGVLDRANLIFDENNFRLQQRTGQLQRMQQGKHGTGLWAWRKFWSIAAGISEFVIPGAIGKKVAMVGATKLAGLTTKQIAKRGALGTQAGIQSVITGHASLAAKDVYDETGNEGLAAFAGVASFIATNAIFKAAGGSAHKMTKDLSAFWKEVGRNGSLMTAANILGRGEVKPFAQWLTNALKIEGWVVGIRWVEHFAGVAYQEIAQPEIQAARFQMTEENFWSVTGHAAEEGLIFIGMPTATKTMGGTLGHSARKLGFAMEYMRGSIIKSMRNVFEADVARLEKYIVRLDKIETENQSFVVIRNALRNMLAKERGEVTVEQSVEYDASKGAKGNSKKARELQEASEFLDSVFGEGESAKPVTGKDGKPGEHRGAEVEHPGSPEAHARTEADSVEYLASEKKKRGEEDIAEPVDAEGEARREEAETAEATAENLARDAIADPVKLDALEARRAELEKKKTTEGEKLKPEEKNELERLNFAKKIHELFMDITGGKELTGEARAKGIEHWEKALKETDKHEIRHKVMVSVKELFKPLATVVFPTGGRAEVGEFAKARWGEFITNIKNELADAGIEATDSLVTKLEKVAESVKGQKSHEVAVEKANKILKKLASNASEHRIAAALSHRKMDNQFTSLTPRLDNLLVAIKNKLQPSQMELDGVDYSKDAMSLREAVDSYKRAIAERRGVEATPAEIDTYVNRIEENIRKAEGGNFGELTVEEMTEIASFIESLHQQHRMGREFEVARQQAEFDMLTEQIMSELDNTFGFNREMSVATRAKAEGGAETLMSIFKAIGHGMHANGRAADYVEYISGGTNTTAYRVLVKDVHNASNDALKQNRNLQKKLTELLRDKYKISKQEAYELSEAHHQNNHHNGKYFKPRAIVEVIGKKGNNILHKLSSGEIVGLLMQLKDPSTRSLWYEGNAGLKFSGSSEAIRSEKQGEVIDSILKQIGENSREQKVADAIVDFLNSSEVKQAVRDVGIRQYGIDIISRSGGLWVPRKRSLVKGDVVIKEEKAVDLFDASREEMGLDVEYGPRLDKKHIKERTGNIDHDILVGDGQMTINGWMKALTNLQYLEPKLTLAQRLLRGKLGEYKEEGRIIGGGRIKLASQLLKDINKNFYEPAIRAEQAMYKEHQPLEKGIMMLRNNLVSAGLAYNLAIPLYQPLSLIAAVIHMGEGSQPAMWRAIGEYVTGGSEYRAKLRERATDNSGVLWHRLEAGGNASALVMGESMQARNSTVIIRGEKQRSTAEKGMLKGRWKRFQDVGMKGIEGFDHAAVQILYRATELQMRSRWKAAGRSTTKEKELFDEVVRRTFEATLIETQPSFHPLHQPAIINSVKEKPLLGVYTMFKGYTGKLTALQRRAAMRAARSAAQGNNWEAMQHLKYGAQMTMIGSAIIPFIRNAVKMSFAAAGAETAEALGLTEEEFASVGDYGLAYWEKSKIDAVSQILGMTAMGDAIDTALTKALYPDRRYTEGPTGPFGSTLQQMFRAIDSVAFTRTDAPAIDQARRAMAALRSGGAFIGLPGIFGNTGNSIISQIKKNAVANYERNTGGGFMKRY